MGWFGEDEISEDGWVPPAKGLCSCSRHVDEDLLDAVVPYAPSADVPDDDMPMTIGDLIDMEALAAEPVEDEKRMLADGTGPYHWNLWFGDETRLTYDEDADLELDAAVMKQDGVERAAWLDTEVMYIGAPRLCSSGALAVAALGLLEPGVREIG